MKTVILLIMMICCTSAGFLKSNSLKKRLHETEGMQNLIKNTKSQISTFKRPLSDAIQMAALPLGEYELPTAIAEHLKNSSDVNAVWHSLNTDMLTKSDVSVLDEFFALLGAGGQNDGIRLCTDTAERLYESCRAAKEACEKKCTLYKSLGFLCGLLIVILFV